MTCSSRLRTDHVRYATEKPPTTPTCPYSLSYCCRLTLQGFPTDSQWGSGREGKQATHWWYFLVEHPLANPLGSARSCVALLTHKIVAVRRIHEWQVTLEQIFIFFGIESSKNFDQRYVFASLDSSPQHHRASLEASN